MEHLFYLSSGLILGILFIRIMRIFNLPNITGYLIAGIIAGPFILNLMPTKMNAEFDVLITTALGFIAFSIGNEFKISHIKQIGLKVIFITLCESLFAVLLVDFMLIIFKTPPALAITLGAMAATTAPAATLLVVRQYKAKGPITDNLLPVVAMDDAVGLMAYSISVSIAGVIVSGEALDFVDTLLMPLFQIIISIGIGIIIGSLISFIFNFYKNDDIRLTICIASIILGLAIASKYQLSNLLLCMAIGATLVNLRREGIDMLKQVESWTAPLFMMFFVISGAELNLSILPQIGVIGVIYILCRIIGKYVGTFVGATITKSNRKVRKYLGFALIPQAGVAIGMSQLALKQLPEYGQLIQTVILSGTLVYELVGPIVAKLTLEKAGELSNNKQL